MDRDVDYLINNSIPYSDMTETEIDAVVGWKCEQAAAHSAAKTVESIEMAKTEDNFATWRKAADEAKESYNNLISMVLGSRK